MKSACRLTRKLSIPGSFAMSSHFSPIRRPLDIIPLDSTQTRNVHDQVPFSGPPSYSTITRRFSSHPNPLIYFAEKKAEEAAKRGEFIDVHDGSFSDDFDVLITDVTDEILRTEIAELVGIPYLEKATQAEAKKILDVGRGFLYGDNYRPIFPCVVSREDLNKAHWVFFLADTGSPKTYVSTKVSLPTYCMNVWPLT